MKDTPLISVLMAAYNAQDYLDASIKSILSQSFTDFEFIIINDGSTDKTSEILKTYIKQDSRIRILSQKNTGLTVALNKGLKIAKGKYIARQDTDDISYPHRLQKQFNLMETELNIVLCGGNCDNLYPGGLQTVWGWQTDQEIRKSVFFKTPFAHSTAFMRADIAKQLGGYDESFKTSQDMEFWMRFAKIGKISMIQEPIIQRQIFSSSISVKRRWRQFYDALRARWRHNPTTHRTRAIYHSLRSLLIGLLPHKIIAFLQTKKQHNSERQKAV